jgi:desulfoferrodoxin-like iron-binding protein
LIPAFYVYSMLILLFIPMANQKEGNMAVKKVGDKFRCNICGNEVTLTKVGGGTLVCCGKPMEQL